MNTFLHAAALACAALCTPFAAMTADGSGTAASDASAAAPASSAIAWRADDADLAWGPCPPFLPAGCAIAVLQGDPAAANADVFFSVPGGSRIARHWHRSAERMVLVAGEMQVTYDGHAMATLRPGSYAYGPARLPHSAICAGDTACVLMIAFEQPVDAFEGEPAAD
jgi:quercetin dioxygenase-like cupin family protein